MVVLVSSVIGSQGQQRRSHVAWLPCVKKEEKKKKREIGNWNKQKGYDQQPERP